MSDAPDPPTRAQFQEVQHANNPFNGTVGRPIPTGALVSVEQQRAIAEVQARMIIARSNPRQPKSCMDKILVECARPSLAQGALYQYARGGTAISGPSIRLAEAIARCWGNIASGIKEISRDDGYSECVAYAWDLETGYYDERQFQIKHWRDTKSGGYRITDERDIYELIANLGQRRKRAVILTVIPGDVVEAAVTACEETLRASADTSPEALKKMILAFAGYGVNKDQIEARCQCRAEAIRPAQVVQLSKIFASITDGMSGPEDWFDQKIGPIHPAAQGRPTADAQTATSSSQEKPGQAGTTAPKQTRPRQTTATRHADKPAPERVVDAVKEMQDRKQNPPAADDGPPDDRWGDGSQDGQPPAQTVPQSRGNPATTQSLAKDEDGPGEYCLCDAGGDPANDGAPYASALWAARAFMHIWDTTAPENREALAEMNADTLTDIRSASAKAADALLDMTLPEVDADTVEGPMVRDAAYWTVPMPTLPNGKPHFPNYIAAAKKHMGDTIVTVQDRADWMRTNMPTVETLPPATRIAIDRALATVGQGAGLPPLDVEHNQEPPAAQQDIPKPDRDRDSANRMLAEIDACPTTNDLSLMAGRMDVKAPLARWEHERPELLKEVTDAAKAKRAALQGGTP